MNARTASELLHLTNLEELDDVTDITVVMSREELEAALAIDAAIAARTTNIHERPTRVMKAVKAS